VESDGLHNVGDGQNPCLQKNIIFLKTLRIAGSIHPFMMLKDDIGHGPGKFDVF
jgi:hypothetical protein